MKTLTFVLGLAAVGAMAPDLALAQQREFYEPTIHRTAALQPMPPSESPSDKPAAPPAVGSSGEVDNEFKKWDAKDCKKDEDKDDDKSCTSSCDEEDEEEECPKYFGGWLRQSYTWNPQNPANRFNGPVTFTDRSNQYQMNQLYAYLKKDVDTDGCGVDVGGRVDVLYGTDARFTQALGLDDRAISDADSRFYKLAIPQMYASFGWNDLTVNIGHFYTIIGYETVMSPQNFFVTQSFLMQYGEPFTHTGVQATYKANDNWTLS